MKLDGLIFMQHTLPFMVKREEDPSSMLCKQRKRLFCGQFILYATMFSLDLLTSVVQLNSC